MRLSKAMVIALKDLKVFMRKRSLIYSLTILPFALAIGLSFIVRLIANKAQIEPAVLTNFIDAFGFFFVILATVIPTTIAAYSLVGEKIEKSLEPLLATPVTDTEIFLGKSIAGFLPPLVVLWVSSLIYMGLVDTFTFSKLGNYYYPNWHLGLEMLLVVPVVLLFSVELGVIVSSKVSDVRTAQTLGGLAALPFGAIYVASEIQAITLNDSTYLAIAAIVLAIDVAMFFVTVKLFQREAILTTWK